jgi:hypothetical protein
MKDLYELSVEDNLRQAKSKYETISASKRLLSNTESQYYDAHAKLEADYWDIVVFWEKRLATQEAR